jgi:hypothetical protein
MKIKVAISTQPCDHPTWVIIQIHGPGGMKYGGSMGAGSNALNTGPSRTGVDSSNWDGRL